MNVITYRPLHAGDEEQIQVVAMTAWHWTYQDIFTPAFIDQFVQTNYAPDRLRQMLPIVERGEGFFEVALDDQHIIGFCQIGPTPQGARLFRIYLLPAYVGQGIGDTLLKHGEAWLRTKGVHEYGCYVHSANKIGKDFYERQGFKHQPEHDQDDEWYMHKTLVP